MEVPLALEIIILVVLLALSAFFSSAETALTSVSRVRIETLAKEEGPNKRRALRLLKITNNKSKMISAILIGNNLVNIFASSLATMVALELVGSSGVGIATGILTFLVLVFGEITPKTMASKNATRYSLLISGIILALMTVFTPVIFVLNAIVKFILLPFRNRATEDDSVLTSEELMTAVSNSNEGGTIEDDEKEYIENVLDFSGSMVRKIMTPKIDITMVKKTTDYDELINIFSETMYTRYPVCDEDEENIIGILNMKDILLYDKKSPFQIMDFVRDPYFTFEQKNIADLFDEMRKDSLSMAIVLDEYGAVVGLVSLEDLLEEIVGEIRDEYDMYEEDDIVQLSDKEYLVIGSTNLSDLADRLPLDFKSEDYDTIGGYLLELFGHFPKVNETYITDNGTSLRVIQADNNRIDKILIKFTESPDE